MADASLFIAIQQTLSKGKTQGYFGILLRV